jgi:hypothetical protein
MALTESEIKVIIAAEVRKAGFDKAAKATTGLDATFKRLGKTIAGVFAARQIIAFGRASVNAFSEAEREANMLRSQLTGINLAFATPVVDDYIDKLELLTGRAGGDLTTAFNSLSLATQDITKAQQMLNLALDISAATGKDLTTVSGALQRAYKGEVTAIARLRVGLTSAELKGKKFAFVVRELERRFSGSSLRAAGSFGTSIDRLRRSVEQAQEAIGEGFVKGLQKSGKSIEETQEDIIALGKAIGETAAAFTTLVTGMTSQLEKFLNSSAYTKFRDAIDFLFRQANFVVTGELLVPKNSAMEAGNRRRAAEKAAAAELRARNQILKQEKKNAETLKKIKTEEEKRRKIEEARKRAQTIFDMENIQIVAAMQGKIDGEQRMRLTTLLALNTENYTAAEKLSDIIVRLNAPALSNLGVLIQAGDTIDDVIKKLITSQAKLAGLQLMAEDFPELDNPFEDWESTLENILALLMQILNMSQKSKNLTGIYAVDSLGFSSPQAYQDYRSGERASIVRSSASGTAQFNNSSLPSVTNNNMAGTNVVVNVAGNVTTQSDLVSAITDALYQSQKDGKNILYSSTAI